MTPEPGDGCWKSLRAERCESPTLAFGRNRPGGHGFLGGRGVDVHRLAMSPPLVARTATSWLLTVSLLCPVARRP